MDIRIIKSPSAGTMQILRQRITDGATGDFVNAAAVGLVQGKLIDMICAADGLRAGAAAHGEAGRHDTQGRP